MTVARRLDLNDVVLARRFMAIGALGRPR
jgi:hypothetical protein